MRKLLFLALALTFAACDSGSTSDPDSNALSGTYRGSQTDSGVTTTLSFTIPNTTSGAFTLTSGTYTFSGDITDQGTLTGSGTYTPPNVTLTVMESDPNLLFSLFLTGTVSDDGSRLTLLDEDLRSFTLTRQ